MNCGNGRGSGVDMERYTYDVCWTSPQPSYTLNAVNDIVQANHQHHVTLLSFEDSFPLVCRSSWLCLYLTWRLRQAMGCLQPPMPPWSFHRLHQNNWNVSQTWLEVFCEWDWSLAPDLESHDPSNDLSLLLYLFPTLVLFLFLPLSHPYKNVLPLQRHCVFVKNSGRSQVYQRSPKGRRRTRQTGRLWTCQEILRKKWLHTDWSRPHSMYSFI